MSDEQEIQMNRQDIEPKTEQQMGDDITVKYSPEMSAYLDWMVEQRKSAKS